MSNTVKVIDTISQAVLFETSIENMDSAYSFAMQMEEVGLDIEIKSPGLAETLIRSLGANERDIESYKETLEAEIDEHNENDDSDYGCAICPPNSSK